jgi:hypothetical protein
MRTSWVGLGILALAGFAGCGSGDTGTLTPVRVESCMQCHNGSITTNYAGPGLENPHPFPGAASINCTG